MNLLDFYRPAPNPSQQFLGQTDASFQDALRTAHAEVTPDDCHFYHTLDLGQDHVVPGAWDIRGNERDYLGHVQFGERSVIEFGPASGYLSFWMEEQGADVTAFDLAPGHPPNLVPLPGIDLEAHALSGAETARQVRNSWWYAHRERGSRARAAYGDIYHLPADLGRYDISTFGSILLHLANPFGALQQGASVTDHAMVVTEPLPEILFGDESNSFMEFNPGNETENLVNWWCNSPGAIAKMLRVLGFPHVDIHFFEHAYHPFHNTDEAPITRFMFAAVGQRSPDAVARLGKSAAEVETDRELRSKIPGISVDAYNDAHRRLQKAHAELENMRRSLAWKLTKPLRMLTK